MTGRVHEPEAYEISLYLECPHAVAEALFDQMCDLACDCTDAFGRCTYCGQEHPKNADGDVIPCADAKPCRNPVGGLHPARSEEDELRLYSLEALEAELARRRLTVEREDKT